MLRGKVVATGLRLARAVGRTLGDAAGGSGGGAGVSSAAAGGSASSGRAEGVRSAPAKALLVAAGVEHLSGDIDDRNALSAGACLPDLDTTLPANIAMLTESKVSVPASIVLRDLEWASLKDSPMMEREEYAHIKEEIEATMARLQHCEATNQHLSPEYCTQVVRRFWSWVGLSAVATTLAVSPSGTEAVTQLLGDTGGTLPLLRKYERAILRMLERGEYDKAERFAARAIQSCDRLKQMLDASYTQLTRTCIEARSRFSACMVAAGGVFVVALGCEYVGFLPEVSGKVADAVESLRDLVLAGTLMVLGTAAANWLISEHAAEYIARVRDAQNLRLRMKHRLEELVTRSMFAREGELLLSDDEE